MGTDYVPGYVVHSFTHLTGTEQLRCAGPCARFRGHMLAAPVVTEMGQTGKWWSDGCREKIKLGEKLEGLKGIL